MGLSRRSNNSGHPGNQIKKIEIYLKILVNENALIEQFDNDIRLRMWWRVAAVFCFLILFTGFALFNYYWRPGYAWRWLLPSLAVILYILAFLKNGLRLNHKINETHLLPALGIGNWITLFRAILIAILAGLLFLPWSRFTDKSLWLTWLPGIIYLSAAILDYFDGFLARLTGHETQLGELFDTKIDALGLLVATLVAIRIGQLPIFYLFVGLAYYLFQIGIWFRGKFSKPVIDLNPRPGARLMAGFQMGFVGVILFPILKPPVTTIAAFIFMIPFLLGFLRDWLVVRGQLAIDHCQHASWEKKLHRLFAAWFPLVLRFLIIIAGFTLLYKTISAASELNGMTSQHFLFSLNSKINIVFIILFITIGLGVFGRSSALFLSFLVGHLIVNGNSALEFYLIFISACCLLLTGSGLFSVWQPEDKIIMGNRYSDAYLLDCGYGS